MFGIQDIVKGKFFLESSTDTSILTHVIYIVRKIYETYFIIRKIVIGK
jgi:hypothetical protein